MTRWLLFLLVLLFHTGVFSQPFVRQVQPFPVLANGNAIGQPFAGGINSPIQQFVDIDGDGDYDLFVFDNDLSFDYYRNEGTRFAPNFMLRDDLAILPKFSVWFRFVDFDGDGKIDLCTEDTTFQGVRVYRNVSTDSVLRFAEIVSVLRDTLGSVVYTGGNSIPVFADLDGDGDLDLFSANLTGTINLYRNVGTRTLPRYAFVTSSWQNVLIFGDSCSTTFAPLRDNLHGAAAYTFADIDGDGDLDLFIGDLYSTSIFFLRNAGTAQAALMQCVTNRFPQNAPLLTGGFNQTSFVDIDGDGDLDLFSGTLAGIVQRDGFHFYRNTGTPTAFSFQHVTDNYLSTIDVGLNAAITFADIDGDGDQDMFIGNINGELTFFRNTGSATSPSFVLSDSIYLNVPGGFYLAPAFVDIDGDGDQDVFAGMYDGTLKFFRNNGTPQSPQFVRTAFPATDSIDVGFNATPVFVDIDNDGDKDLFIGTANGQIRFYRNIGSSSTFIPRREEPTFLHLAAGRDANITPTFCDYDNDGDFDLFFGGEGGRVEFYENIGSPNDPQFIARSQNFAGTVSTQESAPAFADIDGDGDMDLFVGVRKGGSHFYRNDRIRTAVRETTLPATTTLAQNYPNPFNPTTTISFTLETRGDVSVKVYDLLGREVATLVRHTLPQGRYESRWDASGLPSGVYFYTLTTPTRSLTRKMILVK